MSIGAPLANYLSAKRVGNLLYLSGVIAVDPTTRKVVNAYEDLPMNAQTQLQTLGYNTGQLSVDIYEAPCFLTELVCAQPYQRHCRSRRRANERRLQVGAVFPRPASLSCLQPSPRTILSRVSGQHGGRSESDVAQRSGVN